ncbi:MAG: hypothetical protein RJA63_1909 [Pseudomonadota bacterium]|jgi:hypothetical protein|nr:hypothetical protein [Uliginosibacterium sp.]
MRTRLLKALSIAAIIFGVITVFSGGRALFGDAAAQAALGNTVGFVLWFNFIAGFAYVLVGAALWQGQRWASWGAGAMALATALVAAAFGWHVMGGGAFEMRTVGAMAIRLTFWLAVFAVAWRTRRFS